MGLAGGGPLTTCSSCCSRWEEELSKRMNLQTMVDTLQEVRVSRVPRVPSRRGWQVSYEAMLGKAGQRVLASIAPALITCHLRPFTGQKQDLGSLGLTG